MITIYESQTYEAILHRALARIPEGMDKRQGSILWDALAPACAELAQMYIELDHILKITFAETAAAGGFSEWLTMRCSEFGVHRFPATYAVRLGLFFSGTVNKREPMDVPVGSRFTLVSQAEPLHYVVTEKIATGQYRVQCEATGIKGNQLFGRLVPVDNIGGLSYAELADVLIPGEEEEPDAELYKRFEEYINEPAYGGNIADYKRKVRAMEGVGDCRVYPVWHGGGTVKIVVIASDYNKPSSALVSDIQEALDPEPYHQEGRGLAPIGHWVTVEGVGITAVSFTAKLQLTAGVTLGQVEDEIKAVFADYLYGLAKQWGSDDPLTGWTVFSRLNVRVNQLEAKILDVAGVVDIFSTTLNGAAGNLVLDADCIPVPGEVSLEMTANVL